MRHSFSIPYMKYTIHENDQKSCKPKGHDRETQLTFGTGFGIVSCLYNPVNPNTIINIIISILSLDYTMLVL